MTIDLAGILNAKLAPRWGSLESALAPDQRCRNTSHQPSTHVCKSSVWGQNKPLINRLLRRKVQVPHEVKTRKPDGIGPHPAAAVRLEEAHFALSSGSRIHAASVGFAIFSRSRGPEHSGLPA